jgi:uncharacterized protein YegP (UPF0339 family)
MAAFEIYQDAKTEYRWRLRAGNRRIIADCAEGYRDRADCEHGVELLRTATAPEFYRDTQGGHRWRLRASNGRIVADSGEAYVTAAGCRRGFAAVQGAAPQAPIKS